MSITEKRRNKAKYLKFVKKTRMPNPVMNLLYISGEEKAK